MDQIVSFRQASYGTEGNDQPALRESIGDQRSGRQGDAFTVQCCLNGQEGAVEPGATM